MVSLIPKCNWHQATPESGNMLIKYIRVKIPQHSLRHVCIPQLYFWSGSWTWAACRHHLALSYPYYLIQSYLVRALWVSLLVCIKKASSKSSDIPVRSGRCSAYVAASKAVLIAFGNSQVDCCIGSPTHWHRYCVFWPVESGEDAEKFACQVTKFATLMRTTMQTFLASQNVFSN